MLTPNKFNYIRVAAATPKLKIGDIDYNIKELLKLAVKADDQNVQLLVFPELCITGYTLGDLFHQQLVLDKSKKALQSIQTASKRLKSIILVGLPLAFEGKIFNAAAVISRGKLMGIVPKTYIPGYKEFYEERWFASARDIVGKEISIWGLSNQKTKVPIGTDLLFRSKENPEVVLGIEICEDLWGPLPPSSFQVIKGATIIANLSASNELIGKADYRRNLISQQSARGICGYVYSSCGVHESTTDVVFGGHSLIAENGTILTESKRFQQDGELIVSEIDVEHLLLDRERITSFGETIHEAPSKEFRFIDVDLPYLKTPSLNKHVDPRPFIPQDNDERDKRVQEIFSIQTAGLAKRMSQAGIKNIILGLSGGLDSTLALLVAVKACHLLNLPLKNIYAFSMPGFATSKRTKSNSLKLAQTLGINIETINISAGSLQQLKDIKHDGKTQDITFQNVQARYRTMLLMDKSNQLKGLVLGTGDLSEIALGWNTYTGDHISHYNVNASIPKTLVKYLVNWASKQKTFSSAKKILIDILETPISPELVSDKATKDISQKTEELIGPYELHDFFLYHFARWESSPSKIQFLAEKAFQKKYKPEIIKKWLKLFITRFFHNQWKRSVMPDGPKVGSVSLSPRGDWRMPSDAEANIWLKELK